jgi:predicted metal-dependent phosphoesterase TrpH
MGLADLHIHTTYSWDGTASVSAVLKTAAARGLSVLAITDHNEIEGAHKAQELAPAYGLEIVPGIEISTADGHLLALFVSRRISAGLSLEETLQRIGDQGGLAVAAHPAAWGMNSLSPACIRRARQNTDGGRILVGIETFNASLFHRGGNATALPFAHSLGMASLGNSDAHSLSMIGRGMTGFTGNTAAALRLALVNGVTQAVSRPSVARTTIAVDWLSHFLLRRAGWVTWNPAPGLPIKITRMANARADY